jgi:hypothetical protein
MSETRPGPSLEVVNPGRFHVWARKLATAAVKVKVFVVAHRSGRQLAFQAVCAFFVLFGISYFSVPVALIIGGVGGILAVERQAP